MTLRSMGYYVFIAVLMCTWLNVVVAHAGTAAPKKILATTKVLALMVAEVVVPNGTELEQPLLPSTVSPHDFSLRASHIRRIQEADLVVWLGPKLEPYLAKIMTSVTANKQLVIELKPKTEPTQLHPWTAPSFLSHGMQSVAQRLGTAWQDEAWVELMVQLKKPIAESSKQLAIAGKGYLVYHDGIGGFEKDFELSHLMSFSNANDQAPGAKRLAQIFQLVAEDKVACILVDHEAKHKLIDAVIGPEIKRIPIDILGAKNDTLASYVVALQQAILSCMG